MKKIVTTITLLIVAITAQAQAEEVVVEIGDTLYFDRCDGENYTYIDYFNKTRFETDKPLSDTATGWNYYNTFFETGDFDVSRLTCAMKGKYGVIRHMMMVELKDVGTKAVFIAEIEKGQSAAYIIEDAFTEGEVIWSPAPR